MSTAAEHDVSLALRAEGRLAAFNKAGILASADVHVATTLGRLAREPADEVLLAAALAVRAVRLGSVCVDLSRIRDTAVTEEESFRDFGALDWPDPKRWYAACESSPLCAVGIDGPVDRPLRLIDDLLYLDRYWRQEELVRNDLLSRASRPLPVVDPHDLSAALTELFPDPAPDYQRLAAAAVAAGWTTVVAGGPGTGKTTMVARLIVLLRKVIDPVPRIALTAPTGKAAARLQEAVATETRERFGDGDGFESPAASTVHRLLGFRPGSRSRFKHDHSNRLPFDAVIVDETSMVSLTLMSRLLEALRPDARVIFVGDPDQLASVEAGAVLGDLVHRNPRQSTDARASLLRRLLPDDFESLPEVEAELRNDVVRLRSSYRFAGHIRELAEAVRTGNGDAALTALAAGPDVELVVCDDLSNAVPAAFDGLRSDIAAAGRDLAAAARAGEVADALDALRRHRLLCAHRSGPYGVQRWSRQAGRWSSLAGGWESEQEWYPGRPLLVTANDYDIGLYNGDTGVMIIGSDGDLVAAFERGGEALLIPPSRLSAVQTMHAMTVHRSQGSQFDKVSLILPPDGSPLLTRELLYTAVTRARTFVRIIGTEAALRQAVARPIVRASGLRRHT